MLTRHLIPHRGRRNRELLWGRDDPFASLHSQMDHFLDDFLRGFDVEPSEGTTPVRYIPRIDVRDKEKEIEVTAELPGLEEKDIDVAFSDDVLTIKGEKKQEQETKEDNYYRMERSYGSFQREVALPAESVDAQKVDASFKNGVLKIRLPKKVAAEPKVKKIDIKAG